MRQHDTLQQVIWSYLLAVLMTAVTYAVDLNMGHAVLVSVDS